MGERGAWARAGGGAKECGRRQRGGRGAVKMKDGEGRRAGEKRTVGRRAEAGPEEEERPDEILQAGERVRGVLYNPRGLPVLRPGHSSRRPHRPPHPISFSSCSAGGAVAAAAPGLLSVRCEQRPSPDTPGQPGTQSEDLSRARKKAEVKPRASAEAYSKRDDQDPSRTLSPAVADSL